MEIEPTLPGSGVTFASRVKRGAIPQEYISAVEKGIKEAAEGGIVGGYPVVDLKATLYDGSFHEVDSSDMAFKVAASMAFKEGLERGNAVMLEPMMSVEIVVPEEHLGDIVAQISSRRGDVLGMDMRPGKTQAVKGMVPLADMFGYATELRSATHGRGVFTMEFDHYAKVSEKAKETA
jgi:elongation factor G